MDVADLPFSTTWQGTRQAVIGSYLFTQYADDDDLQAFVAAFNTLAQEYVDWFNNINLPIYTGDMISGGLLDWVGLGLYGVERPVLAFGTSRTIGPFGTYAFGTLGFGYARTIADVSYFAADDDVYKRVITWGFYRGDGRYFNMTWLKRRVLRFLFGANGTDPTTLGNLNRVNITVSSGAFTINVAATNPMAQTFQACVEAGIIELPFQYTFTVNLV
jgi:hypothetical protein